MLEFEVFGNLKRGHDAYSCNNSTKFIARLWFQKSKLRRLEKFRDQAPNLRNTGKLQKNEKSTKFKS
jgi:hypothetical protein